MPKVDFVDRRQKESWKLDKKIPVSFLVAMLFQTAIIVSWASRLDAKVEDHERRIVAGEVLDRDYSKSGFDLGTRLARVETTLSTQLQSLDRIERYTRELVRK